MRPAGAGGNSTTRPVGEYRTMRPVASDERGDERLRPPRYNSAPEPTKGPQKRLRKAAKKVDPSVVAAAKREAAKRGLT